MDKILFISDTSDGQNWGCQATSKELRRIINENYTIKRSLFLSDVNVSGGDFILPNMNDIMYLAGEYQDIFCKSGSIISNIYNNGVLPNKHLFDYLPKTAGQFERRAELYANRKGLESPVKSLDDIDEVIINGEGSIHDIGVKNYRRRSWSLLFMAYMLKKEFDKKVHIVNHTLEITSQKFQSIVELVYPLLDSIVFRDPSSIKEYRSKIGEGKIIQSADAAWLIDDLFTKSKLNELEELGAINFWHPTIKDYKFNFNNNYICLGLGSGFHRTDYNVPQHFTKLIRAVQDKIPDTNIILTAASSGSERDMLEISERTSLPLLKTDNNYRISSSIIGNSEVYLGGRWHVSIFSLIGGSRLVNFSGNTFKIESLRDHISGDYPIYKCESIVDKPEEIANSVVEQIAEVNSIPNEKERNKMRDLALNNIQAI